MSKNTQRLILIATSILLSRAMFAFINDPEGPNLLIVAVTAAIVYFLSSAISALFSFDAGSKSLPILLRVLIQLLLVTGFYFALRFI